MGLTTNLLGLLAMEATRSLTGDVDLSCSFPPSQDDHGPTIVLDVTPTPSLRDLPNLHRVILRFHGKSPMGGTVQKAAASNLDAVILQGISTQRFRYLVGLSRSGEAVLTIQPPADVPAATRSGICVGHDKPLLLWKPD